MTQYDIRAALDLFRPTYDRTEGKDGFVSLEVSPYLARKTAETQAEAKQLWQLLDRPNAMIKIPGTPEGLSAIEESLFEGININVTLLFSVEAYEQVAHAYIRALKRRVEAGRPVDRIASVASFFVSRIDTEVDKRIHKQLETETNPQRQRRAGEPARQGRHRQRQERVRLLRADLRFRRVRRVEGQGSPRPARPLGVGRAPRTRSTPTPSTSTS